MQKINISPGKISDKCYANFQQSTIKHWISPDKKDLSFFLNIYKAILKTAKIDNNKNI